MVDMIDDTPSNPSTSPFEDDELSVDSSGSFLGDIHVLTTLISGAGPHNVYSSQSHEEVFGIDSDSSFVGYIDGVHSFHTCNNSGSGTEDEQVVVARTEDPVEYDSTVATSQSTEGSSNLGVHVKSIDEPAKVAKKKRKKSFRDLVSSLRRTVWCRSSMKTKK